MANSFFVVGVPVFVNVATEAALKTAYAQAKPGTVITLTQVVTEFSITFDASKASPGVCVVMPPAQAYRAIFSAPNLHTEILGGTVSAYTVDKTRPFSIVANGISALPVASHFAVRGNKYSYSKNHVAVQQGANNFELTNFLSEEAFSDIITIANGSRFLIDDHFSREPSITIKTFGFFTDGRPPQDAVGSGPVIAAGGFWIDGAHNDLAQINNDSRDWRFSRNNIRGPVQGLIGAQSNEALPKWVRAEIVDNDIRISSAHSISAEGTDILLTGNIVGPDPDGDYFQTRLTLARHPNPAAGQPGPRFKAGLNTQIDGTMVNRTADFGDALIDPYGPINGDNVVPPNLPRLHRMPWAPTPVRPAYTAPIVAPEIVDPPKIRHTNKIISETVPLPSPGVGVYLSSDMGGIRAFLGSTGEWRWKRNGVVVNAVAGTNNRVYLTVPADSGQQITVETRRTNNFGTGDWVASLPLTIL